MSTYSLSKPNSFHVPIRRDRTTATLLLLAFLLYLLTFLTLNRAIGWPYSLGAPAQETLPAVAANQSTVTLGYYIYLASAVLMVPLALGLYTCFRSYAPQCMLVATAFGVIAGVLKALGIVRWIVLMPELAGLYLGSADDRATQQTITLIFAAFNTYAGAGVGEHLGVQLFTALWLGLLALTLMRAERLWRWVGATGLSISIAYLTMLLMDVGLWSNELVSTYAVVGERFWYLIFALLLWWQTAASEPETAGSVHQH